MMIIYVLQLMDRRQFMWMPIKYVCTVTKIHFAQKIFGKRLVIVNGY